MHNVQFKLLNRIILITIHKFIVAKNLIGVFILLTQHLNRCLLSFSSLVFRHPLTFGSLQAFHFAVLLLSLLVVVYQVAPRLVCRLDCTGGGKCIDLAILDLLYQVVFVVGGVVGGAKPHTISVGVDHMSAFSFVRRKGHFGWWVFDGVGKASCYRDGVSWSLLKQLG